MKNITVSVPEEVYHRARVKAAEERTSVSAMVKGFLENLVGEESEFRKLERLQEETLERIRQRGVVFDVGDRLTREQLHDRAFMREQG